MEDHATGKIAKPNNAIPKDAKEDGISELLKKLYTSKF